MPVSRRILVLSLAFPIALLAQQKVRSPTDGLGREGVTWSGAQPASLRRRLADTVDGRAIPTYPADSIRRRKLGHYTLHGLGAGAAIGIVGGLIGSRFIACGCSDEKKTFGLAFWFGGIGASAGGLVGALIGGISDLRAR